MIALLCFWALMAWCVTAWALFWAEAVLLWRFHQGYFAFGPKIVEWTALLTTDYCAADLTPIAEHLTGRMAAKKITPKLVLLRARTARCWPHLPPIWSPRVMVSCEESAEGPVLQLTCRHATGWPALLAWPALVIAAMVVVNNPGGGLLLTLLLSTASLSLAVVPFAFSVRAARRECCRVWQTVMGLIGA